jgi:hypothetical protein
MAVSSPTATLVDSVEAAISQRQETCPVPLPPSLCQLGRSLSTASRFGSDSAMSKRCRTQGSGAGARGDEGRPAVRRASGLTPEEAGYRGGQDARGSVGPGSWDETG